MVTAQRVKKMSQKNGGSNLPASPSAKGAKGKNEPGAGAGAFIGDVKAELFKITWTGKEELKVYTKIVVIATFVLGLAIYTSDLTVRAILNGMGVIFRMIAG